jgi:hypothetical protein
LLALFTKMLVRSRSTKQRGSGNRKRKENGAIISYHTTPTASVDGAVCASAVPGQADEQTAVVAKISRPPRLRLGQQRLEICLECLV